MFNMNVINTISSMNLQNTYCPIDEGCLNQTFEAISSKNFEKTTALYEQLDINTKKLLEQECLKITGEHPLVYENGFSSLLEGLNRMIPNLQRKIYLEILKAAVKKVQIVSANTYSQEQIIVLSKHLQNTLVCPIGLCSMDSPMTLPCGHTYDAQNIFQSLEYKKVCPQDRELVTVGKFAQNYFVKDLTKKKVMVVFLSLSQKPFQYDCPISRAPLFEAVKLPCCDHQFNKSEITKIWHELDKACPLDNTVFDITEIKDDPETIQLAKKEYPKFLKKIKASNLELTSKVIELRLDDRCLFVDKFLKVIRCPISKNVIESPMMASCGHTFDVSSIKKEFHHCPLDGLKFSRFSLVPNRMAADVIEIFSKTAFQEPNIYLDTPSCNLNRLTGVFLFLKPETTLERIYKIRNILIDNSSSQFCHPITFNNGRIFSNYNNKTLSQIDFSSEKIPVLHG